MQVGVELDGGGEDALAVLALALAVELLPPFRHEAEARLVAGQQLNAVALAVEQLPRRGVLPCGILGGAQVERLHLCDSRVYHAAHVDTRDCHRQQADRGQDAEAPADVVRHNEALPAVLLCKAVEHALVLVGGGEYMLVRLVAVLLCEYLAEDAERDCGLKRRAGLGNDVHVKVHVAERGDRVADGVGGKGVAHKEDPRVVLAGHGLEQFYRAARAEVGAAYADDDQRL